MCLPKREIICIFGNPMYVFILFICARLLFKPNILLNSSLLGFNSTHDFFCCYLIVLRQTFNANLFKMCLPNQDFHKCACKIICRIAQIVEVCLHLTNCYNFESSLASQTPILKEAIRNEVRSLYLDIWREKKVEKLVSQGSFIELLESEQSNVTWKSIIYGVPRGVMAWAMRSSTNTLATPDNLKRWKRVRSDACVMCK